MPDKIPHRDNAPFFLVGCVRSGTTLLRDFLRLHPRLECPEETHFFRWADPFGSDRYRRMYLGSQLFKEHRKMDGLEDFDFDYSFDHALDRREIMDLYAAEFVSRQGNPEGRWFDKTPQNVYGMLLLSAYYPEAKFIHIHRHPLNVVSSLMEGAVMPAHTLSAAINYWMESMHILDQFKAIGSDRLLEVSYEKLCAAPLVGIEEILDFVGERFNDYPGNGAKAHPEKNKYLKKLDNEQIELVLQRTEPFLSRYGYAA